MTKIIGSVDLSSHGISSWQKKENRQLASLAAKKRAAEKRRRQRENTAARRAERQWGAHKKLLECELGRKLSRKEKKAERRKFYSSLDN